MAVLAGACSGPPVDDGAAGGTAPSSAVPVAFCEAMFDDIERTYVADGMSEQEVEATMRRAARHYERVAGLAPEVIRGQVLQVALNYQVLADAMESGEGAFQVLLTPPSAVDLSAIEAVAAHLTEHCPR